MKIKILIAVVVLNVAAFTQAHGFGLGAQFNYATGNFSAPGAALVFSPSRNFHIAGNWYLSKNVNTLGLTFDWRPLYVRLANFGLVNLNFTLDAGIYTNFIIHPKEVFVTGGVRLPIGLNLLLLRDFFEIYTHVAPSVGVQFNPSFAFDAWFFPIALGVRVWLF